VEPGLQLDGRFEIQRFVASGGMSAVFSARDRQTGRRVAVKVFEDNRSWLSERSERESTILSELRHPNIVSFVEHGLTPDGRRYLAMEWVEGKTLRDILRVRRLTVRETVRLAQRVSEALGEAHRRGIVHLDLKPANLIVTEHAELDVKVLDFGLAGLLGDEEGQAAALQGTPGYMSPEQAERRSPSFPSDVFSLGCVLYECLTQSPAFFDNEASAALLKAVASQPEPLSRLRPRTPPELLQLIERMLAKDPATRPDCDAILAALGRIDDHPVDDGPTTVDGITLDEQRITSLFVLRAAQAGPLAFRLHRSNLADLGFTLHVMMDGTTVGVLAEPVTPLEAAIRGIRAASRVCGLIPQARATVALGPVRKGQMHPSAQALDAAFARLDKTPEGAVSSDEAVALLTADRFDVVSRGPIYLVEGERSLAEEPRPVLGRITPLVGRETEVERLQDSLRSAFSTPEAALSLCTGESGLGKSRVLWSMAAEAGRHGATVLRLRAELNRQDSLGVWRRALREHFGLRTEMTPDERRAALGRAGVSADEQEVLSDWLSVSASETVDPLRSASERRGALGAWFDRVLQEAPLAVFIDDAHAMDPASVDTLAFLLQRFDDRPLFVMAAGPSSVENRFDALVEKGPGVTVRLERLPDHDLARLVDAVLGDACDAPTRHRIIEQAQGNPFVLEELLRAVARGESDRLPESVLGLIQARMAALSPSARRLLRAASIYGRRFWTAGLAPMVDLDAAALWAGLEELERAEIIRRLDYSELPGDVTYRFRHSLIREAAYESLPREERRLGHLRAAEWLEDYRLAPPRTIADHWERGGQPRRAVSHYREAAEAALGAYDLDGALEIVRQGRQRDTNPADRGALLLTEAEVRTVRGEFRTAAELAFQATQGLEAGSARWFRAQLSRIRSAGQIGRPSVVLDALAEVRRHEAPAVWIKTACLSEGILALLRSGLRDQAEELGEELRSWVARGPELDPMARAHVVSAEANLAWGRNDVSTVLRRREEAATAFREAGDTRLACAALGESGTARIGVGDLAGALELLLDALEEARRVGLPHTEATLDALVGHAYARQRRFEHASRHLRRAIRSFRALRDRRGEGRARAYLAAGLRQAGELEAARSEADRACAMLAEFPQLRAGALAVRAQAELELEAEDPLSTAAEAYAVLRTTGAVDEGEMMIHLVYARSLEHAQHGDELRSVLAEARTSLLRKADGLKDGRLRTSFLVRVPEHAQLLALARRYAGPDP
jgi:hypothetical protein